MYQERMFETWKKGLLYLAVVIAMPILPVIIYMITGSVGDGYLYVLLITVIGSFVYEFMNFPSEKCELILKTENIICCVTLTIMLVWDLFLLLLTYSNENNIDENIKTSVYFLVGLFGIPVIIIIIEIIRCVVLDVQSSKYKLDKNNLVKGAREV